MNYSPIASISSHSPHNQSNPLHPSIPACHCLICLHFIGMRQVRPSRLLLSTSNSFLLSERDCLTVGPSAHVVLAVLRLVEVLASSFTPLAPFTSSIFAQLTKWRPITDFATKFEYLPPSPLLLAYLRDRSPNLLSSIRAIAQSFIHKESLAQFPQSSRGANFATRIVHTLVFQIVRMIPADEVRLVRKPIITKLLFCHGESSPISYNLCVRTLQLLWLEELCQEKKVMSKVYLNSLSIPSS